jgi:hypothetical protein
MKRAILVAALCVCCLSVSPTALRAQGAWVNYEGCYCGTYPLPPVRFEVIGSGTEAERSWAAAQMSYWNEYANIFDPCVDVGKGAPNNGKNELVVFMSPADAASIYGVTFGSDDYGITILIPESSFGYFNQCRDFSAIGCGGFTETDILVNAGFSSPWTTDPYNFNGALVQATALHELGHAWGAHHVFDLSGYSENAYSCMNYMSDYGERFVTRMDANTIRYSYSGREQSATDFGVFPLSYGQGQYAETYANVTSSVVPGGTITIGPITVHNCGTSAESNVRVSFYLSTDTVITSSDYLVGWLDWASFPLNSQWSGYAGPLVVQNVPNGYYYVGGIVTVWGSEDAVTQNNRMLLADVTGSKSLRRVQVYNSFNSPIPAPEATPSAPSFGDCCVVWCGNNYVELDTSPSSIVSGGALTLNYECSFSDVDYYGVPVNIYLALIKDPTTSNGPSTTGQALSGGTVYLWHRGMRSSYVYKGRVQEPTWSYVSFPPQPTSGALNMRLTAPSGTYCWATAFVNAQTGQFIRTDL